MDFRVVAIGFFVGTMVGLTGMGGGALMTPLLILFGWAKPMMAVGTDLMWNTLTKCVGGFVHYRQRTVDLRIVKRLAIGSVPGALLGLGLLDHFHRQGGSSADQLVVQMLGVTLLIVASTLLFRTLWPGPVPAAENETVVRGPKWVTPALGFVVGFLVSLTSVGSGSLIVATLVVIYPFVPLKKIVGSDIVHAVLLVGMSAVGHLEMGSINLPLLAGMLLVSLPGVWIGSRMSTVFPPRILRPILAGTLMFLGYKLL
ncbi:MAG: sulfite exporter TauE/SafE family protein [Acidobacteriota bacterium]|nr:sulfite exporter TauE/SafE family protein [Acidobacteriota bacterium]